MKSKINANRALMAEKSKFNKFLTLLAVFTLGVTNVWGTEVTVGYTTGLGDKNATTTTRSIADVDHVTITHIINSGTSDALSLYAKSDKSLYYGSSTATYSYGGYKWNKNTGTTFNDNYVGFQVDVEDGYKLSLSELELTLAVSAGFTCKVEITDGTNNLYSSDSWAIANNGKNGTNGINPTFTAVGNPDLQDLTGTFYVRVQLAFNGTGKYLCCPIFTVTGELEETGGGTPVDVTGITLAPSSATIKVGKTVTLVPTITPNNATDKTVTWAVTSGSTYASVSDAGVVTGLAAGTAVITATAHDGSGVTQTATITVEDCPTSGTLFSMNITAAEGTTYTGNNTFPALIEATYVGGQAYSGSKSGTNRTSTIDANGEYPFSANSELAIKVVMDCDLAEGDIIDFTTSSTRQIKIQKVVGTDLYKTASKTFTIPSGSALIGENVFYLMRENSESTLGSLTVTRPIYRTITLEYADGTTPDGSLDVIDGTAATKPADPTWEHHRFAGWYNGSDPYDWSETVGGDLTLTAHWTQLYTITYAAGDGTATGDAPIQADKAATETFTVAANPFTVAGKDFVKWNDGTNDYAPGATYIVGTDNVVLTAQWKAAADKYTVIFKDGETTLDTKLFEVGSNPSDADIDKTKPLFAFAAWQKEGVDIALDDAFWATVVKDATVTLTARWTKAFALDIDFEAFIDAEGTSGDWGAELAAKNYAISSTTNVTLDAPDSKPADKGLKIKNSGSYISFNVNAGKLVLLKAGVLSGAEASVDGGANYTALSGASGSTGASVVTPLYNADEAEYRIRTTTGSYNIIQAITITDPFTVSFDANGGDDVASLNGTPSVTLPSATKGTESFLGWFDGETKVGEAGDKYTPTASITLKAHWEAVSTDARLASITFSAAGTLSPAFDPEVTNYTYTMPYGTAAIPTITDATSVSAKAQAPVIDQQAAAWGQTAIIRGVAESGDSKAYNITMKLAPKDGICLIKGNVGNDTFVIDEEASLLSGTADKNNVRTESSTYDTKTGWKFNARPARLGITLSGAETFQAGDIVEVFVTTVANISGANDKMRIFDANEGTSAHLLVASEDDLVQGANRLVLPTTSTNSLYLHRTKDGDYDNFNPYVAYVAVYRPMNPILTAITFAGEAGTINESLKTVTVTVPNATDLGSMTVVPTIVRNAPHATTPEAVITNAGAWVEGPNTYRIMDKDGDYTDYTVTITRAALSTDATLSALSYGTPATAIALADGVYTYDVELPYGTSDVPALAATKNHVGATIVSISDAAAFVDRKATSTVTVKAEDNTTTQVYTVNFEVSRFESKLIWDGSTMSALSDITAAATAAGVSITSADISVTSFSAVTCEENGKSYTKALNIGGNTKSTRYFGIEIPAGKVAKVSLVYKARGNDKRSIIIGTAIVGAVDESAITSVERENDQALHIMTADMFGGGTLYINTTNGFHVHEISIQLADGYARSAMLGNGVLGTVCVPNNVAVEDIQGATFYELAGREPEHGKLAFDEITSGELEAGVPYLFQAQGNHIALLYGATSVGAPVDKGNGMYGTFSDITLTELDDVYYFAQKALWGCSDLTSLSVPANRAYVKLSKVDNLSALAPAPGRRRILMGVNGENQATGFENIESGDAPMKVMIDGTLYILRGEKVFDATGRLVK